MGDLLTLNLSNRNGSGDIWHNGELIPVIKYKHMPRTITYPFGAGDYDEKVFSFYKGVIVEWDEDMDTRVLTCIDEMDFNDRIELLLVYEHEAGICLQWRSYIPDRYTVGSKEIEVCEDWWFICTSCKISYR